MSLLSRFLRPRFSLWAMLVVVTVAAIPLSCVAQRRSFNLRRLEAYERLMECGVLFEGGASGGKQGSGSSLWESLFLDRSIPEFTIVSYSDSDEFATLRSEYRARHELVDSELALISLFPETRTLRLVFAKRITDRGLEVVGNLPHLDAIDLQGMRHISGEFLEHLPLLNSMSLDIGLAQENVKHLQRQTQLNVLCIRNAPLQDDDLRFLTSCKLEYVILAGLPLRGDFLRYLKNSSNLGLLQLTSAPITDEAAKELSQFRSLTTIDLSWTPVSGEFLDTPEAWRHVKSLSLSGTRFSEKGKERLAHLKLEVARLPANWGANDLRRYALIGIATPEYAYLNAYHGMTPDGQLPKRCFWELPTFGMEAIDASSLETMASVIGLQKLAREEAESFNIIH